MNNIRVIAWRELKTLFLSPVAWSVLAIVQLIFAFLFLSQIETFNLLQPKLATIEHAPGLTDIVVIPLFGNAGLILMLVTPLLTMRTVSEERRNKTLALLLSAPVTSAEIVLGKYLSVTTLLLIIVALTAIMPLSLLIGGTLDIGKFAANVMALSMLVLAFASVGVFMSCLAGTPTLAAMGSFGVLLLLWIVDWSAGMRDQHSELFEYLSILRHYQAIQTGLLASDDLLYFIFFTIGFLLLSGLRLALDRLQK